MQSTRATDWNEATTPSRRRLLHASLRHSVRVSRPIFGRAREFRRCSRRRLKLKLWIRTQRCTGIYTRPCHRMLIASMPCRSSSLKYGCGGGSNSSRRTRGAAMSEHPQRQSALNCRPFSIQDHGGNGASRNGVPAPHCTRLGRGSSAHRLEDPPPPPSLPAVAGASASWPSQAFFTPDLPFFVDVCVPVCVCVCSGDGTGRMAASTRS
jgi:hypothetical protein